MIIVWKNYAVWWKQSIGQLEELLEGVQKNQRVHLRKSKRERWHYFCLGKKCWMEVFAVTQKSGFLCFSVY